MFLCRIRYGIFKFFILMSGVCACQAMNMRSGLENPMFGSKPPPPRNLESARGFQERPLADNSQFSRRDSEFAGRPMLTRATYFKQVNESTWRTRIGASILYPLIVRQLSESYILKSSDTRAMSIQTDWDKFFIGGRLFRNRLSISLFQLSQSDTELVINNKVEYFQQSEETAAYGESDWIPTQDITNEKSVLIEGLSKILHAINVSAAAGIPNY